MFLIIASFDEQLEDMGLFYSDNNKALHQQIVDLNNLKYPVENFNDDNVVAEFVIDFSPSTELTLSSGSQSKGTRKLKCKLCGNEQFTVGQAEFFTLIKCESCDYELGIHEG